MKNLHDARAASVGTRMAWGLMLGIGALSSLIAAPAPPPAPVGLASAVNGSTVTLSWKPGPGSNGSVSYQVEAGSGAGAANLAIAPTKSTSMVVSNVADGLYYVRVRAKNNGGLSAPSNEISVRVGCAAPPNAPGGYGASVSGTTVAFAWQPSAGAKSYALEVGSAPGASNVASMSLTTTSYSVTAPVGQYYTRVRALNSCGSSTPTSEVLVTVGTTEPPPPPPPPPPSSTGTAPIFGIVDPVVLGTCTADQHDVHTVNGGDGYRYRTWHPQTDPSGCVYAHEHGDNPAMVKHAEIAASPVRFGYIGRRHPMPNEPNGHEEAHEGFKVFVANPGDVNDEGRVNRVYSRSVFHMGTGGPKRFNMPHHSAEVRLIHPEFGLKAFTQLMMDTGGVGAVCDPRKPAPVKDVIQLNSPCKLNSGYEIWSTTQSVMFQGQEVYRVFATPAVFDPITVFNPANPTELVYAWDARVAAIKNFPDDWTGNRGCHRESYAQPGYWYNSHGPTRYYTDAMGGELASTDPLALLQEISATDSIAAPATNDGLVQFKMARDYCQQSSKLGLKN